MKKIKILYIVSTLEAKGPTNQLFYIIKHLDVSIFESSILTLSPEPSNSFLNKFLEIGISVTCLGTSRFTGIFKNLSLIKNEISKVKPDVVQSMGIRADSYVAQLNNVPCLTTSRNFPPVDYPQKYGRIKGTFMAIKHLKAFKNISTIACSQSIQDSLKSVGVNSLSIPNGIDIDLFNPGSSFSKVNLREVLGLPINKKIAVTIGSLIYRKNVEFLISGFNKYGKDLSLLIVGEGNDFSKLQEMAKNNPNIYFLGHQSNVRDYLLASDVFVSASRAEGLPNAVLESLACGLPVALSNIPPHREIVSGSIFEKSIFSIDDEEQFMSNLCHLIADNVQLKEEAKRLANKFSARSMSDQYQKVYKNLTKGNVFKL